MNRFIPAYATWRLISCCLVRTCVFISKGEIFKQGEMNPPQTRQHHYTILITAPKDPCAKHQCHEQFDIIGEPFTALMT